MINMLGQRIKTNHNSAFGNMICNVIFYESQEELLMWKKQIGNCNSYIGPKMAWYWWYE